MMSSQHDFNTISQEDLYREDFMERASPKGLQTIEHQSSSVFNRQSVPGSKSVLAHVVDPLAPSQLRENSGRFSVLTSKLDHFKKIDEMKTPKKKGKKVAPAMTHTKRNELVEESSVVQSILKNSQ